MDDSRRKAWGNIELTYCSLSGVGSTRSLWCSCRTVKGWVSEPEYWCLFGWPFCLQSSCVVDGSPVRRERSGAVVYLHLFHLAIYRSTSAPSSTHSLSTLTRAPSSSMYSSFSSFLFFLSLSFSLSIFACLFPPVHSPPLPFPPLCSSHFQPKG